MDHLHGELLYLNDLCPEEEAEVTKLFDDFYLIDDDRKAGPITLDSCNTSDSDKLLLSIWNEIIDTLHLDSSYCKSVESHFSELRFKESLSCKHESRVRQLAEQQRSMIKIDVGGQIFCATKETLLRCENSYFAALLNSGLFQPDHEGWLILL